MPSKKYFQTSIILEGNYERIQLIKQKQKKKDNTI